MGGRGGGHKVEDVVIERLRRSRAKQRGVRGEGARPWSERSGCTVLLLSGLAGPRAGSMWCY